MSDTVSWTPDPTWSVPESRLSDADVRWRSRIDPIGHLAHAACEAGAISREQADAWIAERTDRAQADRLFVAIPLFLAAATRP